MFISDLIVKGSEERDIMNIAKCIIVSHSAIQNSIITIEKIVLSYEIYRALDTRHSCVKYVNPTDKSSIEWKNIYISVNSNVIKGVINNVIKTIH